MLAYFEMFKSFASDIYMDYIAYMVCQLHHSHFDPFVLNKNWTKLLTFMLALLCIYFSSYIHSLGNLSFMLEIYFVWFHENIYQIMFDLEIQFLNSSWGTISVTNILRSSFLCNFGWCNYFSFSNIKLFELDLRVSNYKDKKNRYNDAS